MNNEKFYKNKEMPFAECRYSENSGRRYKLHIHKRFSVGAIAEGEVIYQVEDKKESLKPGSLALINPETIHSCNPVESRERSYYTLYLDVSWCMQLQQSLWQTESFRPVKLAVLRNESIFRQFIDTMDTFMSDTDLFEKENKMIEIAANIFLKACGPAAEISVLSPQIERIKEILGSNLDAGISLKRLAENLNENPFSLLRRFKAASGITPYAYHLNCRIELAKELLRQGRDLTQVALDCGFFDQSHFHRHFKALTATTPREYQLNFIQ